MSSVFPTWSNTNRAVQPQKIVKGFEFRIKEVEELYYQSSKNKGAGYRAADVRLCFRICNNQVFS